MVGSLSLPRNVYQANIMGIRCSTSYDGGIITGGTTEEPGMHGLASLWVQIGRSTNEPPRHPPSMAQVSISAQHTLQTAAWLNK